MTEKKTIHVRFIYDEPVYKYVNGVSVPEMRLVKQHPSRNYKGSQLRELYQLNRRYAGWLRALWYAARRMLMVVGPGPFNPGAFVLLDKDAY